MRKNLLTILLCHICGVTIAQNPMARLLGPDAPATTYWTYNPSYKGTNGTLSGGNLTFNTVAAIGSNTVVVATLPGGTTGKSGADYYYEVSVTTLGNNHSIGICNSLSLNLNTWMGADAYGYAYYCNGASGGRWEAGTLTFTGYTAYNNGDVVGILFKGSTNQVKFYSLHSGVTTLEATLSIPAGSYFPAISSNGSLSTANFGASAWQLSGAPFGGSAWAN